MFTVITFFIFLGWLAMEVIDVYMPPGKHNVSTSETVTQKLNGTWPIQEMSMDEFFVAYKLHSGHFETEAKGKEDQYFSGIWIQRTGGEVNKYYSSVNCTDLWVQEDVPQMFWENIKDFKCPDMKNAKTFIQNPSSANFNNTWSDFFFVIDTCEHLKPITKRTDCKTEAESQAILETIYAVTKIQTAFWNTKNYLRNGKELNSEFATNEVQLNSAVF